MPPVKLRARSHSYSHLNCWFAKWRLLSITLMGAVLPVFGVISDEGMSMTPLVTLSEQKSTDWKLINDTVMGGVSNSQLDISADIATFSGHLSLEQNGGFTSTRISISQVIPSELNLIRIHVKGDGRTYQLRLRTDDSWDSFSYSHPFITEKDRWVSIEFKADDFIPVYRGRALDAPQLNYADIKQVGFLLADKQAGDFALSFKNIELIDSNRDK